MTSPREKVLSLVASGRITSEEGDQLLTALRGKRSRIDTWFVDPFELIPVHWAWVLAIAVSVSSVTLAPFKIRFSGALDLRRVDDAVSWTVAVGDQLVAWPLTGLCFWFAARLTERRASLTEMLALVGAARLPLLLAACLLVVIRDAANIGPSSTLSILLVTLMPLVAFMFLTLLSAFRTCTGASGRRLAITFFVALVSAEAASKVVLKVLELEP